MRTALALLLTVPMAIVAAGVSSSCTTSGDLTNAEAGLLPDGGTPPPGGEGGTSTAPVACVFEELQAFTCPGVTLAPPEWVASCVDEDDCKTRVNGSDTVAGCARKTTYADVQKIQMTCAAWKASGQTLPVLDAGPAPVCAPGSVSGFAPTWHPPRAKATTCTSAQIASYLKCLDDAATSSAPASCKEWSGTLSAVDQACIGCLSSNATDAQYGPLVLLPTEQLLNVAGCIALAEGKTDGSGCGGALQADQQCTHASCLPTCETGTSAQVSAEVACETQANQTVTGVCATYAAAAGCAGAIQQGGDAGTPAEAACFGLPSGTADAEFTAVAMAFCGSN